MVLVMVSAVLLPMLLAGRRSWRGAGGGAGRTAGMLLLLPGLGVGQVHQGGALPDGCRGGAGSLTLHSDHANTTAQFTATTAAVSGGGVRADRATLQVLLTLFNGLVI